jgi:ATP-dependent protease HslVU (ClpYQ) peptidase subunit
VTTIAYCREILAGDSQASDNQNWRVDKLLRLDTSAGELIVGYCGEVHSAHVFIEWLKDDRSRKPDISSEDFEAIVVSAKTGRVTIWNQSLVGWTPRGKFFAIGSGAPAAMGAMHAGKNAIDAVKIACKVDPYTRGPVRSLKLR